MAQNPRHRAPHLHIHVQHQHSVTGKAPCLNSTRALLVAERGPLGSAVVYVLYGKSVKAELDFMDFW